METPKRKKTIPYEDFWRIIFEKLCNKIKYLFLLCFLH